MSASSVRSADTKAFSPLPAAVPGRRATPIVPRVAGISMGRRPDDPLAGFRLGGSGRRVADDEFYRQSP
jgi:hypothetical protein